MQAMLIVKVTPRSKRNAVLGRHGEGIKLAVTAVPEAGRANTAVIQVIADWLKIKSDAIDLTTGASASLKRFKITGISQEDLDQKIENL